jgi:uncharacterized protein YaeQ
VNKKIKLPKKPVKPDMSECCQRACENCIFIYYEKALKRWEDKVEKIKNQNIT